MSVPLPHAASLWSGVVWCCETVKGQSPVHQFYDSSPCLLPSQKIRRTCHTTPHNTTPHHTTQRPRAADSCVHGSHSHAYFRFVLPHPIIQVLSGASPLSAKLKRELTTIERLVAALGAGIVSAVIYTPVDLLTIQQQQMGMSLASCASRIMQDYGPLGFVRGVGAMAVREGIFTLGMFGLTPIFSEALQKNVKRLKSNTVLANLLGSLGAGITAALLTHPMDTIKTRIQNDMMGVTYKNILNTLNLLLESKGWGALYIGSIPRTLMICVAFFIVNMLRKIYLGWKTQRLQLAAQ